MHDVLAGAGAHFYPITNNGFNFGLGGGWAFGYIDSGAELSLLMGPGFSASLGFDDRVLENKNWRGRERHGSFLYGLGLRFTYAPSIKGDDYTGHTWAIGFALTASI